MCKRLKIILLHSNMLTHITRIQKFWGSSLELRFTIRFERMWLASLNAFWIRTVKEQHHLSVALNLDLVIKIINADESKRL